MRYFILAGEASGDLHASNLMDALKKQDQTAEFVGLGGDKMREAGCRLLQDYRQMAYMGVIAVLANLNKIKENFRIAEQGLLAEKPDVLILIDYPSFNLKIGQYCKQYLPQTKIVYYIPPKIWAWKTYRVHEIARVSDLILGIFPFEPAFYAKYGYKCEYVGNPTMDAINQFVNEELVNKELVKSPIIALLPGSRKGEIKNCLPKMLAAAREVRKQLISQFPNLQIVVTAAPGIDDAFYQPYLQGEKITRDTYALVRQATAAVVNSGTATLETALLGCPQTAVYRIVCSRWLGWIRPFVFKIPFFTLVNIIPAREVIKELIAYNFTTKNIVVELTRLLTDEAYRQQMLAGYNEIRSILGDHSAATTAAKRIVSMHSLR
ncbi:MAG: lipid-A-disaccharide synthase [Paludibacteraceae bacterium]|nr:lipid-A-disaccharide synthase [Paludibacteraceae bacterium]